MKIPTKLTKELEELCINTDPFAGGCDEGESVLSDKIVTTRKDHLGACYI